MGAELLRTRRMVLREFDHKDLDSLVELDSDPQVTWFITGGAPTPVERAKEMLDAWIAMYGSADGLGFWVAEDLESREFLGWFHMRPDRPGGEPELGYRLRRAAWGRGLATEGSRALVDGVLLASDAPRVIARTMAVNTRSRRVMEKCGMQLVRTFYADWPVRIPGDEHGDVEYAITRAQWLAGR